MLPCNVLCLPISLRLRLPTPTLCFCASPPPFSRTVVRVRPPPCSTTPHGTWRAARGLDEDDPPPSLGAPERPSRWIEKRVVGWGLPRGGDATTSFLTSIALVQVKGGKKRDHTSAHSAQDTAAAELESAAKARAVIEAPAAAARASRGGLSPTLLSQPAARKRRTAVRESSPGAAAESLDSDAISEDDQAGHAGIEP